MENLELAYALQHNLELRMTPTVWDQGIFALSRTALESLVSALDAHDFAVFIFAPNDLTKLRDSTVSTVRDNVVFEFGLFIGRLGSSKCFFVVPRDFPDLHLPSDLLGITPGTYDASRADNNWRAALGPVAVEIAAAVLKVSRRENSKADSTTPRNLPLSVAAGLVGLTDIEDRKDELRALPPESIWEQATEEIVISGPTLSGIVNNKSHYLHTSLRKHRRVKLLLLNPESKDFARIAALADRDKLESELDSTISKIIAMGWPKNRSFEARYLTLPMMYSATLLDGGIGKALIAKPSSVLRIQPYLPTLTPHAGLVLQFSPNAERDIFGLYRNDIKVQWETAAQIPALLAAKNGS